MKRFESDAKNFLERSVRLYAREKSGHGDKWHLEERAIRISWEKYILWQAVDSDGYEVNIFIQKDV